MTGASSGIGFAIARALGEDGYGVTVSARRPEKLDDAAKGLSDAGLDVHAVTANMAEEDEVKGLAAAHRDRYGRLDVLVNNAGYPGPRGFRGPEAIEEVERLMATNFFGAVYCTGELMDLLIASAPSSVVNVSSVAGRIAAPGLPAYTASKFALVGWSESLNGTIAHKGVHVASVEPGFIPTEGFPQTEMVNDPMMKRILGTEEMVSEAIQDAVRLRKPQRVVPRMYYLAQVPQVAAPRLWRSALGKMAGFRDSRR